jgi:tetratricopeptide (TPR) repeat protein
LAIEYKKTNTPKALDLLKTCSIKFPEYLACYYHLGKLYEDHEDYQAAAMAYQKGIDVASLQNKPKALAELMNALGMIADEI